MVASFPVPRPAFRHLLGDGLGMRLLVWFKEMGIMQPCFWEWPENHMVGAHRIEEVGRCWYYSRHSAGGRFTNVDSLLVVQKYKLLVGHNWSATDCRFAT